MGSLVGKVSEELPKFTVLKQYPNFEVRHYAPRVVAEFAYRPEQGENTDMAFRALARYIGVFTTPENTAQGDPSKIAMTAPVVMGSQPEKISMTAPVVMGSQPEQIAMTAPVTVSSGQAPVVDLDDLSADEKMRRGVQVMQFNLPRQFTLETAPRPTNPRVNIREVPAKFVAAVSFSGRFIQENIDSQGQELVDAVKKAGLKSAMLDPQGYYCAGFNPPWTLPMFRKNEVYVDIEPEDWMKDHEETSTTTSG